MARKNLGLADELAAMDEGFDPDQEPPKTTTVVSTPAPAVPSAVTAAAALDPVALGVAIAQALGTAQKDSMIEAIRATKEPKRENEVHADKSVYNPYGELHVKRPGLKCEMFWGVFDERDPNAAPVPLYAIESQETTIEEQTLLNAITAPWETVVERNDERPEKVRIVATRHDITGDVTRMVFGFRRELFEKQSRNQLPSLRKLARQILETQAPGRADEVMAQLEEQAQSVSAA